MVHQLQHMEGLVELLRAAARVDQAVECDDVWLDSRVEHAPQHLECLVDREDLAARADQHGVRGDRRVADVGGGAARDHLLENEQAAVEVVGLRTRVDDRRERVRVRLDALGLHLVEQLMRLGEHLALAARVDQRRVRVDTRLQPRLAHLVVEGERLVELLRLAARVDEDVVRDGVRVETSLHHLLQHGVRGEPLPLLLVRRHCAAMKGGAKRDARVSSHVRRES